MAKDRFDREIDYLRLSVTDRCNLGCIYCVPGEKRPLFQSDDILRTGELVRLVRVARHFGVRKVRLTGGEPLLRPDILRLIGRIKETGIRDLSLTTNGILLGQMAGSLREAGLDRVNVSLDSLKEEKYRSMTGGGKLALVWDGIARAEAAGLDPVKINMVPIRTVNEDEIESFARLTVDNAYHVRFIEFMPAGRKGLWQRDRVVPTSEVMDRVTGVGQLERLPFRGKGPSRNYRISGASGMIGFISPVSHTFCYCCNRLRMNAVGRIRPCLFSQTAIDVGTPLRQGADDNEIERLLALAIQVKPEGNYLPRSDDVSLDSMASIGG